jgi:small basic protein
MIQFIDLFLHDSDFFIGTIFWSIILLISIIYIGIFLRLHV